MNNYLARLMRYWLCLGTLYDIAFALIFSSVIAVLFQIFTLIGYLMIFAACWFIIEFYWWLVNKFGTTLQRNRIIRKYFLGAQFKKR
ncbi:MAG TPA: hypothetical protein HA328_01790 [Candidatus Poseidoniaceae archaeon]|nr:hypothetical protein [Candidatus Poseidoniaceae archaeon]